MGVIARAFAGKTIVADRLAPRAAKRQTHAVFEPQAKRATDIVLAAAGLVLLTPVYVLVALVVVLDSGWPAFYWHDRLGKDRRPFRLWKFRTMIAEAEHRLLQDEELAAKYRRDFKLAQDPRLTRVGRALRRTSIDELPQLWNVLRGEMSLVGPRPVVEEELRVRYGTAADLLLSVRPGLTGLWQVSGRSSLDYGTRVALDLKYVADQSIALDFQILARTPAAVVTMRGAV